ncbi:MAG: putative ELAV like protein 2/3/4 [Streblomastix strix]|uniref:Putative ELAV like protein 2/3/4 n=1 Tax=Streblomastix strix TaxID=222440 RepID=A0A5J4W5A3_9EUKA|nr:MAG: putative ELAV like protein 2/3/4 [Streblomastix strix]
MAMRGGRSESVTFSLGFNHLSEFPLDRLESPCRLIMNFLPQQVTNEDVHGLFSQFGTIVNIKIIRDKGTGLCVGYGFIEFARAEEAAMAIRLGNGRELGSKRVKVWYSRKPTPDMKGSNVYLQNYGPELEGWQLVELFSKFGTVININMLRDKSGKSRGAGFVRMDTNLQALNAVNALNGSLLNGRKIFAKIRETQVSAPFPAQGI